MANNQAEFDAIVESISNGSFSDTKLNLRQKGINNADVAKLMRALQDNPEIASKIFEIDLFENNITEISIPDTLIALQELSLGINRLISIEIPETLINLQTLFLHKNQLSRIKIPSTLVLLQKLWLQDNNLTSIDIPLSLTSLQSIFLHENQISSIEIPNTLILLEFLELGNNRLSSIAIPASLTALKSLCIQNSYLSSIEIPRSLIALQRLLLQDNLLSFIVITDSLIALQQLNLRNNLLTLGCKYALANLTRNPLFRGLSIDILDEINNLPVFTKEVLHAEFFGNPENPEDLKIKALRSNSDMLSSYRNSLLSLSVNRSGLIRPKLPTVLINKILSFAYMPYNYLPMLTVYRDLFPAVSQERQLFDAYIKQTEENIIPYLNRHWNYTILSLPKSGPQEHRCSGTKRSYSSAGIP